MRGYHDRRIARHQVGVTPGRGDQVGVVYWRRLGGLSAKVMIAAALDGRNNLIGEIEVARGGRHGMALTPADVLRPMIRVSAAGFILLHNHPSGSTEPSPDDVAMTTALDAAAVIVGLQLLEHVIIAAPGRRLHLDARARTARPRKGLST